MTNRRKPAQRTDRRGLEAADARRNELAEGRSVAASAVVLLTALVDLRDQAGGHGDDHTRTRPGSPRPPRSRRARPAPLPTDVDTAARRHTDSDARRSRAAAHVAASGLRGRAWLPARPVPAPGARRARRGPVGARRRADRLGQDGRRRVRDRQRARRRAAKAFYTTPIKALSNQKYRDLVRAPRRRARSACSPATTPSTATRRSS